MPGSSSSRRATSPFCRAGRDTWSGGLCPEPFSLGELEDVSVVVENPQAAGLAARIADHAPAELRPHPRELESRFDPAGRLNVTYRDVFATGAARSSSVPSTCRCGRHDGWWRRQVRIQVSDEVAVFPNVVAIKRVQLTLRRGLRAMVGMRRARPPGASTAFAGLRDYVRGDDMRRRELGRQRRDATRPVVVEVEAERGQQVMIALDCGRLMTDAVR